MKLLALFAAVVSAALVAGVAGGAAPAERLRGATQQAACAGAGPFFPSMTLALAGDSAWVACKTQRRVMRVRRSSGLRRAIPIRGGELVAVVAGFGAVWSLDEDGMLSRIDPVRNRVRKQLPLGSERPYNLWVGAGSLWSVDDASGEVLRIAPATLKVVARIPVGDGPSDLAFIGDTAWIVNHRDRALVRLETRTNRIVKLTTLPADTPERIAAFGGRLWITGRGTDLLEVDPADGRVVRVLEIGAGGIDVVAGAGSLWVPARAAGADRRGFPTLDSLRRVSAATGEVTTVARARGRVEVHGLVWRDGALWLADNTGGQLYRVAG